VPFTIAAGLPPAQRIRWLRLIAAMPMPDTMPVAELLDWSHDAVCGPAATAVLEAWSRKFASQWEPLIAPGNQDQERYVRLHALGTKAFGARPELRRQLAEGSAQISIGQMLAAISGVGLRDPVAPWVAALDDADAGRRAEAIQILQTLAPTDQPSPPRPTVLRLLSDPCPAVARVAGWMTLCRKWELPADQLAELARNPSAAVRMLAANRLHELGRDADAETVWREVATSDPSAMGTYNGWDQLAEHTRDPVAVRELLLGALANGGILIVLALQRVAGEDPRVLEVLVEHAQKGPWIRGDLLSPGMKRAVQQRLTALLDDANTPAPQRGNLFQNLARLVPDKAALVRSLHHPDANVRQSVLPLAQWSGVAPSAAEWRELLGDPATREQAIRMLEWFPLPEDFDPTPYAVSAVVLAAWADGKPERIARLADRMFAGDRAALDALLRMRADLTPFAARFPRPRLWLPAFWYETLPRLLQLPDLAAEWRIWQALQPRLESCAPLPHSRHEGLLPADAALIAAVQRRLGDPAGRGEALQLMIWLGRDANALLPALRAALPTLTAAELATLPTVVCAIAPEAAVSLCEPLLDHADPQVAAAARMGPVPGQSRIPGGGSIARKMAERLAAEPSFTQTTWFTVLADGIVALPELRAGLHDHPENASLAAAIRDLGPAADAALPELLAALPRNPLATQALHAVLSPKQRLEHLLPLLATEQADAIGPLLMDLHVDDPAALAMLERLADDPREQCSRHAGRLLAISESETPVADRARREVLRHPERGMPLMHARHYARLWPQLTDVERRSILAQQRMEPLPPELADAIAAVVETDATGMAFLALMYGAPLHPVVLARVAAARMFWNPPPQQADYALPALHARALVNAWKNGDAAVRAAALPWLRREPEAAVKWVQLTTAMNEQRIEPLAMLELFEQLGPTAVAYAWPWLDDPDLAVRRQAMRAVLASAPKADVLPGWLRGRLLERTWEEQFGPLEGLPPFCAEIAKVPPVAERAADLRRLFPERITDAFTAIPADLSAARLLLPELRQMLSPRWVERCPVVLACLRRLGTDAAELLPDVEALAPIPLLHFEVATTARILRGEAEAEKAPQKPAGPMGLLGPIGPWMDPWLPRYR
jgi:hypothetical protein